MQYKVAAITQTADELEAQLQHPELYATKVANLKPESRRRLEVLAVRCLLKQMTGEEQAILYDDHGAPSLASGDSYISISHTDGYVAAIIGQNPVGIDIERRGRRVERVRSKFLQEAEEALVAQTPDPVLTMHLIWSAKEAVFKFLGPDYYDLQRLTQVTSIDFAQSQMSMEVKGFDHPLTISFEYTNDYVLCHSSIQY